MYRVNKKNFIIVSMQLLALMICLHSAKSQSKVSDSGDRVYNQFYEALKFRGIGPAGMSGRITAIAAVNANPSVIYVGAASGGVWKSENTGLTWVPVFDDQDIQSIGALAIDQNNPNVIWAGTGEGNPRNSHNSGKGIYKSIDAGKTWKKLGLENTKAIHRIVINPLNPDVVYVGAMGSAWGNSKERGVFQTIDGGITWKQILFTNENSGCAELILDPNNPNHLLAAMWEFNRKPYFFYSGGKGSGLYQSFDGGQTWKQLTEKNGLPAGILGRLGLAIAPSDSKRIYAIVESKNGIEFYVSRNRGENFTKVSNSELMGNRPFYYNEIYVDPKNENRIYSLWSQVSVSEDGGEHWKILADWGHIHPDHHAFYIHPQNPKMIINGNDGGLNISWDGGETWRFIENLPLGQFYHVRVDENIPYNVYGGLQDNGSWKGPGYHFYNGGIKNSQWHEMLFGDGFDVVPLNDNSNRGYAMYQGGNLHFYDFNAHTTFNIKPVHPKGEYLRYNWNAGIALHPTQINGLYFGSQYLHKSLDNGKNWVIISPDLTSNDTAKLKQAQSGGLTIDATHAENYCTIIAIEPSKKDTNVIYVGTDDGQLQITQDAGKTWKNIGANMIGLPKNSWIPFLFSPEENAAEVWVVANNYRQNDWKSYLFKSTDYGKTFNNMIDDGVVGHCLSIYRDKKEKNLVFLGTDQGLYWSINGGKKWMKWKKFPSCPVQDIQYQNTEGDLVIGTFGRSIFILDDIEPLRKLAGRQIAKNNSIEILSATHGYLGNYMQPAGVRFAADAEYQGQNKNYGSKITIQINNRQKLKDGEKHQLLGEVFDSEGTKIRTHHFSFDSNGIYRIHYRLIADGVRFPQHATVKPDEDLPEGLRILPGKYKLKISLNGNSDSAIIEAKSFPNQIWNLENEKVKRVQYKNLKNTINSAYQMFESLKKWEQELQLLEKIELMDDSAKKLINKKMKPLQDSIKSLKLLFMLPADYRPYEDVTVRLNEVLSNAYSLVTNTDQIGNNAMNAILFAEQFTKSIENRIRSFYNSQYLPLQELVAKQQVKLFSEKNFK